MLRKIEYVLLRESMCAQNLYFNKEEERLLRAMLAKMKNQADKVRVLCSCPTVSQPLHTSLLNEVVLIAPVLYMDYCCRVYCTISAQPGRCLDTALECLRVWVIDMFWGC
jgi:hypothetical protein